MSVTTGARQVARVERRSRNNAGEERVYESVLLRRSYREGAKLVARLDAAALDRVVAVAGWLTVLGTQGDSMTSAADVLMRELRDVDDPAAHPNRHCMGVFPAGPSGSMSDEATGARGAGETGSARFSA